MPYMQMTEEQFKVPVLKNVIYALRLVWQTDKRLLIGYLLQEGLYAVFSRYLQNILFLKILLDVITGSGDLCGGVGGVCPFGAGGEGGPVGGYAHGEVRDQAGAEVAQRPDL